MKCGLERLGAGRPETTRGKTGEGELRNPSKKKGGTQATKTHGGRRKVQGEKREDK